MINTEANLGEKKENNWATRRQTLSQPHVDGLIYTLVEQYGNEDKYRITGRKVTWWIQSDLLIITWTAEEINNQLDSEVIYMSPEYKDAIKAKSFAPLLKWVYDRMKSADPYHYEYQINKDEEWFVLLNEYISWSLSENPVKLLEVELEKLGLYSENSYNVIQFPGSLEQTKSNVASNKRWFLLTTPEEYTEKQKMRWNTDLFVEKLISIYNEMMMTNNWNWEIDAFEHPLVKKYRRSFSYNLDWYGDYYYNLLKEYLKNKWYALISSLDNFLTLWNNNPIKLVIKKDEDSLINKQ